jgi:hypothetical protein
MPGFENSAGIGVSNYYGQRITGQTVGVEHSDDSVHQLSIGFTGTSLNNAFLPPVVVPKGASFKRAILRVDEAFTLGGTSPTVIFGGTAPATDGIILTQAELQAIGTKTPASTGTGTWAQNSATGTTAAQKVAKALGGTTPTVTAGVGKATLILEFVNKTKV